MSCLAVSNRGKRACSRKITNLENSLDKAIIVMRKLLLYGLIQFKLQIFPKGIVADYLPATEWSVFVSTGQCNI